LEFEWTLFGHLEDIDTSKTPPSLEKQAQGYIVYTEKAVGSNPASPTNENTSL